MGVKGGSCTRQGPAAAREEFEECIRFDGGIIKAELRGHLHTEGGGGDVRDRAGVGGGRVPVYDEGGLGQRHWLYLNIMSREHLLKSLYESVCARASRCYLSRRAVWHERLLPRIRAQLLQPRVVGLLLQSNKHRWECHGNWAGLHTTFKVLWPTAFCVCVVSFTVQLDRTE